MRALIDADILPYEFGSLKQLEDPDLPLEWEITRKLVDDRIHQILEAVGATEHSLYLTDSASNFRNDVGTILPYKGHRTQEKPYHWKDIRQHLIDNWDAEVQYGIEADDRLGIEQWSAMQRCIIRNGFGTALVGGGPFNFDMDAINTVICSRDKDLNMIPGWHYIWECGKQKEQYWFQDELSAIRCFYKQLLTGDSTDNILGLYGVGNSSSLVKQIDRMETEVDMFNHTKEQYKKRFGSYWPVFMIENAQLLWILRGSLASGVGDPEEEIEHHLAPLGLPYA